MGAGRSCGDRRQAGCVRVHALVANAYGRPNVRPGGLPACVVERPREAARDAAVNRQLLTHII